MDSGCPRMVILSGLRDPIEVYVGGIGIQDHPRCGAYRLDCSSRGRNGSSSVVSQRERVVADGYLSVHGLHLGSQVAKLSPRPYLARFGSPSSLSPLPAGAFLLDSLLRFPAGSVMLQELRSSRPRSRSPPRSPTCSSCWCHSNCLLRGSRILFVSVRPTWRARRFSRAPFLLLRLRGTWSPLVLGPVLP